MYAIVYVNRSCFELIYTMICKTNNKLRCYFNVTLLSAPELWVMSTFFIHIINMLLLFTEYIKYQNPWLVYMYNVQCTFMKILHDKQCDKRTSSSSKSCFTIENRLRHSECNFKASTKFYSKHLPDNNT